MKRGITQNLCLALVTFVTRQGVALYAYVVSFDEIGQSKLRVHCFQAI